jgi:DNA modification methylase
MSHSPVLELYNTRLGRAFWGDSLSFLKTMDSECVDLMITSPPFALQRQKSYGNKEQTEYVDWLLQFGKEIFRILKPTGSFVLDIGGSYQKNRPVRSLYNYRILLQFCDDLGFRLAEEFFWFNPAKLPSPIEWVNKRKIRAKDAVNTIWWFSKTDNPKADVKNVLTPYSDRMKTLLENPDRFYSPAKRPSGHDISKNFSNSNGGAIPSNLLQIPNTESNSKYIRHCKQFDIKPHPARFPVKLPLFFIKFLTDPGDVVCDIFAGSNTTGEAAESLDRKWISCDNDRTYVESSIFRFFSDPMTDREIKFYHRLHIDHKEPVSVRPTRQLLLIQD